jgi:hypothetical protein
VIYTPTTRELEERQLLTEAATTTATLAAAVATQPSIDPSYHVALQDALEALAKLQIEMGG